MKRILLIISTICFVLFSYNSFSQQTYGGEPISFKNNELTKNIDHIILDQPNMEEIEKEDKENERLGKMYMIGREIPVSITMKNSGTWETLSDGTNVWRLKITCPNAMSLTLLYSHFHLPKGSKLFLYNENRKQIFGALNEKSNPRKSLNSSTMMIEGETTYLEYSAPADVTEEAVLDIEAVVYNYRSVGMLIGKYMDDEAKVGAFGNSENCEVNIACPEGAAWQTQKKGVCIIICGGGMCTGDLINNLSNDGTPYILTADHCGGDGAANTFHNWQFYFHFESATCNNPTTEPGATSPPAQGATRISRGNVNGGTDFLLLELDGATQEELCDMNCYYNGWDISGIASMGGVAIHHPSGDIMKITEYQTQLTTSTFTGSAPNMHWRVDWATTANGGGLTEGGSSGSSLFDATNKYVIGTLSGGPYIGCAQTPGYDLYGKMVAHWDNPSNGTTDDKKLKPWLDPDNSGQTTCPGMDPCNATPPITGDTVHADFNFSPATMPIMEGQCVNFQDMSSGNPTQWNWSFPGAETTSSTSQNPQNICYNTAGSYPVTLTASNATTSDTYSLVVAIIVIPDPNAPIIDFMADNLTINVGSVVNFTNISQNGPFSNWHWEFEGGVPNTSTNQTPPPITYNNVGTYTVILQGTKTETGVSKTTTKVAYINVIPAPSAPPTANFAANKLFIAPGQSVNFIDLSINSPMTWEWTFTGGNPANSTTQHPQNITYDVIGCYEVKLKVTNSAGEDELTKTCYIVVDTIDNCTEAPIANFSTSERIIPYNDCILFENTSTGNIPTYCQWHFEGGTPEYSTETSPSQAICYSIPGIYRVSLITSNACGSKDITKEKYIYVFSGDVGSYCEEISSRTGNETFNPLSNPDAEYGYMVGHSSKKYRYFANYFDVWTFNQINNITIPLNQAVAGDYDSYVYFCIWEPNGSEPAANPLISKKVYLRDLISGENNTITFDSPVTLDGPFYAGFKINYPDTQPQDNVSDDLVAAYVINKGTVPSSNKLFFKKNDTNPWETTNDLFGFSAAIMMKANSCLVEIEDFSIENNNIQIFPNPTNSHITILLEENNSKNPSFELMDIIGKIHSVKTNSTSDLEFTMDLSNLPAGIYLLRIKNNNIISNKKIILTK